MAFWMSGNMGQMNTGPVNIFQATNNAGDMLGNIMRNQMLAKYSQQYPQMLQNQMGMSNNQLQASNLQTANMPTAISLQNALSQAKLLGANISNQYLPSELQIDNLTKLKNSLSPMGKTASDIYGMNSIPGSGAGLLGSNINNVLASGMAPSANAQAPSNSPMGSGMPTSSGTGTDLSVPTSYGSPQNYPVIPGQNPGLGQPLNSAQQMMIQANQLQNARMQLAATRAQGFNYGSLPMDQKDSVLAQATGMGLDPTAAVNMLNRGYGLQDIAKQQGFDPTDSTQWPTPIYPATKGSVTQIQRRQQSLAEINNIQPILTQAMAPYSQRLDGFSPKQVADAISGDNPDQQAQFLAAKALMPEMASLRLKAMGGNVGIEAIREVNDASMGNIKAYQALVTPSVYTSANKYVDQWINQGANAANKVGLQPSLANQTATEAPASSASGRIRVTSPDGNTGTIDSSQLKAAMAAGYKQVQ